MRKSTDSNGSSTTIIATPQNPWRGAAGYVPGIFLSVFIVLVATALRGYPVVAVLNIPILAVVVGMVFSQLIGPLPVVQKGLALTQRSLLRLAIVLLGFQISVDGVVSMGVYGIAVIAISLVATFMATCAIGRWIGVEPRLAKLIAAGTSICGASAIIATHSAIQSRDEDATYAVALITLYGTIAMFAFPLLQSYLLLPEAQIAIWIGSAVHEVAQVVGAGTQLGATVAHESIVAKLARVAFLAPLILVLLRIEKRAKADAPAGTIQTPWFIFAFVAVVVLNSVVKFSSELTLAVGQLSTLLLSMGLAAMGLGINLTKLRTKGLKPAFLGLASFLLIAGTSLALLKILF